MRLPKSLLAAALVPVILFISIGCAAKLPAKYVETRSLMDSYVKVTVYADEEVAQEAIDSAFARIEEIERIATSWDSQGEAFKLNQDGYLETPSAELLDLIKLSLDYNKLTDSSFDITVQPLLDLWAFNPNAEKQFWELDETTQKAAVNDTLKLVGRDQIIIENNTIRLKEGTLITLGGIAAGYAVDEALKVLAEMGIQHALIDAGGDIGILGAKPDGESWNIDLVNPDNTSQSLARFGLSDQAITTSGNYERYFDPSKKVHHIVDPETGYSAGECISVTIIAPNCTRADALATGVFVMGPEDGMALVESLDDVEALIVDSDRKVYKSSGLSDYLQEEK